MLTEVGIDRLDILFVACAFLFQVILIIHFAVRKWRFPIAIRYGWIVYGLSIPAAAASILMLAGGKPWWLWLGGVLYLAWAGFGYAVEYIRRIEWRDPIRWPIFGPYLSLYLATVMFYWFPLARLSRALWYIGAALFIASTLLNVTSHSRPEETA
jgi:hypothetical protein